MRLVSIEIVLKYCLKLSNSVVKYLGSMAPSELNAKKRLILTVTIVVKIVTMEIKLCLALSCTGATGHYYNKPCNV